MWGNLLWSLKWQGNDRSVGIAIEIRKRYQIPEGPAWQVQELRHQVGGCRSLMLSNSGRLQQQAWPDYPLQHSQTGKSTWRRLSCPSVCSPEDLSFQGVEWDPRLCLLQSPGFWGQQMEQGCLWHFSGIFCLGRSCELVKGQPRPESFAHTMRGAEVWKADFHQNQHYQIFQCTMCKIKM